MNPDPDRLAEACRQEGVELLVLFGSRAAGGSREGSDTDLAALFQGPPPGLLDLGRIAGRLAEAMGARGEVDLVVLNTAESTTLRREIARSGRVLFDRDGEHFMQFVANAMRDYADFEGFRRLRRQVLLGKPPP